MSFISRKVLPLCALAGLWVMGSGFAGLDVEMAAGIESVMDEQELGAARKGGLVKGRRGVHAATQVRHPLRSALHLQPVVGNVVDEIFRTEFAILHAGGLDC